MQCVRYSATAGIELKPCGAVTNTVLTTTWPLNILHTNIKSDCSDIKIIARFITSSSTKMYLYS